MHKCLYCYKLLDGNLDFHAKCSLDFFGTKTPPKLPYTLSQMAELAKNVVERRVAVPGVQPKLSLSLVNESTQKDKRLTVVGALGGNYIFKPPSEYFSEMPANEHVTMRLAEDYGIPVVPSSLIRLESGELSYITKRIDRSEDSSKIHMLDFYQITEAFDKYKSSMEKVGKALHLYSANTQLDKLLLFELTLLSFIIGNNDMHLKNFSMIEKDGKWVLAPAYDLLNVNIANPKDTEELALTLGGKKKNLRKVHFIQFGEKLDLTTKQIDGVFKRLHKFKPKINEWIDKSFLTAEMQEAYQNLVNVQYENLAIRKGSSD